MDSFERPVDRVFTALRTHHSDAYQLVRGEGERPDAWIGRCPHHPDAGLTLAVSDPGDDREPVISCQVACAPNRIRSTLGLGPPPQRYFLHEAIFKLRELGYEIRRGEPPQVLRRAA